MVWGLFFRRLGVGSDFGKLSSSAPEDGYSPGYHRISHVRLPSHKLISSKGIVLRATQELFPGHTSILRSLHCSSDVAEIIYVGLPVYRIQQLGLDAHPGRAGQDISIPWLSSHDELHNNLGAKSSASVHQLPLG